MNLALNAKKNLEAFIPVIDSKLNDYWDREINNNFGFNQKQKELVLKILHHSKEHNLRPAKRLRASFVYYSYLLNNNFDEKLWNACIAVELVQTALLMHDDFMDQDDIRRGLPTTHKYFENSDSHYGNSMAVNVGDAILCLGFQMLADSGFDSKNTIKALNVFLRLIANTAYGQAYDVTLEKIKNEWEENDVITLHKAKTALYTYENPLLIGGNLGNLASDALKILKEYAHYGGVAFQLQDDILGVYGKSEKTGKSANSDLLQGKCTLLVLKTFKNGNGGQIDALEKVWGKRKADEKDIDEAKKAIVESKSLDYSIKVSKEYAAKASKIARNLRKLNLNKEAIDYLEGIAEYMVQRDL